MLHLMLIGLFLIQSSALYPFRIADYRFSTEDVEFTLPTDTKVLSDPADPSYVSITRNEVERIQFHAKENRSIGSVIEQDIQGSKVISRSNPTLQGVPAQKIVLENKTAVYFEWEKVIYTFVLLRQDTQSERMFETLLASVRLR